MPFAVNRFLIIALMLSLISHTASAYEFIFKKFNVDNGLSENTVQTILQDKQGFMWFGTKDGLNRFDGHEYRIFRHQDDHPHSIGNNFIRTIFEDVSGDLWIGTDNGLYIYNPLLEQFTAFNAATPDGKRINAAVTTICTQDDSTIWIGCLNDGVYRFHRNDNHLEHFNSGNLETSLSSNVIWKIYKDFAGTIWIGTRDGLNRFIPESDSFQVYRLQNSPETPDFNDILAITEDTDGDLWLGTWSGGMAKLDKLTNTFIYYFDRKNAPYITKIRSIFEFEKDRFLVGSDDGLYLFDKKTFVNQRIDKPLDPHSLSDQNVYSIYRDREKGIWIGTYFGGVNYVSAKNNMIEHFYPENSLNSLSGKAISQFCEDESGNLWIATEDGGLNYFEVSTRKFTSIKPHQDKPGLSYHNIHAVVLDGHELWIGTFSRGVDVLNVKNNTFRNYQFQMGNLNYIDDNCVFAIYKRKNGDILIGTPFGLSKFNPRKNDFTRIHEVRDFVYDMQEDARGGLWIATYGHGIFRMDTLTGNWRNYRHTPGLKNSVSYDKVVDIFLDGQQRLWFATEGGGICRYNTERDDFTTIDESSGLPNNVAYGILDDKFGNIWVSTNRGITRIHPETLEMKTYTKEDGLQSNQFNYRSSFKSRNGIFYFGGINGFNAFNPDNLQGNDYIPPVLITGLELLDEESQITEDPSWKRNINERKRIVLQHNQASFRLRFVSMSFQANEKNKYSCIMEGLETKERSIGNQNSLTYINLPPGSYVFRVKGSNNDGIWNETGDYLKIEILPPFWKREIAYLLYAALIFSMLFLAGKEVYRRQHEKQVKRLEDFRLEKEKEMVDSKFRFITNVAHEIRTPVSLIKAPLECILNTGGCSPETKENLEVISRNSDRLLELINQLLDFRKIEEDRYHLHFNKTNINQLLENACFHFKTTARQQKIDFRLVLPDHDVTANIDQEAIIKVVSNLLSNAIKFSRHTIIVSLMEKTEENLVEIWVEDDGPGIPEDHKEKIFEPFFQIERESFHQKNGGTGIGLTLSRQLAERHRGKIFLDVAYQDGCRFVFRIPSNLTAKGKDGIHEIPSDEDAVLMVPEVSDQQGEHMKILIVEDNEELRTFLEKNLKGDYQVYMASTGVEGLNVLKGYNIDLIISDIVMPEMDGLELARNIKLDEQFSHIPVILLSARTNIQTKIEGLEFGADSYIEKPFSMSFLKAQISSLLENRKRLLEKFLKSPFVSYGTIASNKKDERFLERLNGEIEKTISDVEFSIEKLALSLSMSRSNLQRKIKGISGMAPNDYIRVYRLKKAAMLLLQGEYRINEICYLVGFNTPSYFSRCFQKQFGQLPKDFVKTAETGAEESPAGPVAGV